MKKNHKRISAAVLSLALGFTIAGAPMLAPVASAQITITDDQATSVELDHAISLTINKYAGEPLANGGTLTDPIEGVQFKVEKIDLGQDTNGDDLQLDTLAGWEAVKAAQTALQGRTLPNLVTGDSWTLATDVDGEAKFDLANPEFSAQTNSGNFTVGAYLVTEQQFEDYTVAAPFIVTLPHTDTNGVWNYKLEVNPKNQKVEVDKTVSDAGVYLGEEIEYTISASLPAEPLTSLKVEDPLPSQLSEATNVVVTTTKAGTLPEDPREVVNSLVSTGPEPDYTIITNGGSGNDLTITLTPEGLSKINASRSANPTLQLNVTFKTEVIELPSNGEISNDVIVTYPNSVVNTGSDPDDENEGAKTRLGQLTVHKQDSNDDNIVGDSTASATFELWRCSLVGGAWTTLDDTNALPVITDPSLNTTTAVEDWVANNGPLPTSFSTDPATGTEVLYGVQTFNFVDGATTTESNICLVETKAPAGYNLNPQPVPITEYDIDPDDSTKDEAHEVNYAMVANFKNIKNDEIVNLPATGGYGTMALIGAGVLVAAAGGAAAVRGNRARNN